MTEEQQQKLIEEQDKFERIITGKEKLEEDYHKKVSMM